MAAPTNPLAQSSQAGLAPEGDQAKQFAIRRLQKQQWYATTQTPGRLQAPVRLTPPRSF